MKKTLFIKFKVLLCICCLHIVIVFNVIYAGKFIDIDGDIKYVNDFGEVVKDTWCWVDTNNDSIAECFRFDSDGHILKNYGSPDGHKTNENGELIDGGVVVKKMLSNGEIISNKPSPLKGISEFIGNIIGPKNKKVENDKLTGREINYKTYDEIPDEIIGLDGTVINNESKTDIDILMGETAESGIIYAGGRNSEISDKVEADRQVVAGKDFRRFITSKDKCTEKVSDIYVYGGDRWSDALKLSGNGARVKFNLDGNNYIRFEVAHQTHGEETKDTDITLDMYVDNELYSSFDEFVDSDPEIVEEYVPDAKSIELKVNIKDGAKGRIVYIRDGRFKKVKE